MFSKVKKILGAVALGSSALYPFATTWTQNKNQIFSEKSINPQDPEHTKNLHIENLIQTEDTPLKTPTYMEIYEQYILAARRNIQFMVVSSLGILIFPIFIYSFPAAPFNFLCYVHDIITRWRIERQQNSDPSNKVAIKGLRNQIWWSSIATVMTTFYLCPFYLPSYIISTILIYNYVKRCDERNEEGSSLVLGLQTGVLYTVICSMMKLHVLNLLFFFSNFSLGYLTWEMFKDVKKGRLGLEEIPDATVANFKWFVMPNFGIPMILIYK